MRLAKMQESHNTTTHTQRAALSFIFVIKIIPYNCRPPKLLCSDSKDFVVSRPKSTVPNTKKGAGGRPPGRADNHKNKRTRKESDIAKKRRMEKIAATRKANEAKKRADIAASTKGAAIKKRNDFF